MLKLSKQSDYGLIFLSFLKDKDKRVSISEVVKKTNLPKRFLSRIALTLNKVGLIDSKEGKLGGYRLKKSLDKISFYQFLKIFEKDLIFVDCYFKDYHCRYKKKCRHQSYLSNKLRQVIIKQLKKIKLTELFK